MTRLIWTTNFSFEILGQVRHSHSLIEHSLYPLYLLCPLYSLVVCLTCQSQGANGLEVAILSVETWGSNPSITILRSPDASTAASEPLDLWLNPASKAVHVLSRLSTGSVVYHHRPSSKEWAVASTAIETLPSSGSVTLTSSALTLSSKGSVYVS